ncbi:hypothetical protein MA20_30920 [Bradyrhizobium japonicum]|uniref:Uncharacterized protein n=1 Tax=Bradyrhizobium japonicum TaxID=375 RepID=A0A0A3XQU2_BRAJP|nr:hypothetical protein MA20_30920 [Bradyrhizobium japonicum]
MEIIWPPVSGQCDVMAAPIVHTIDQDAVHAHFAHLAEGDFEWPTVGIGRRVAADRARVVLLWLTRAT